MWKRALTLSVIVLTLLLFLPQRANAEECRHRYQFMWGNSCRRANICSLCDHIEIFEEHRYDMKPGSCTDLWCRDCKDVLANVRNNHAFRNDGPRHRTCTKCGYIDHEKICIDFFCEVCNETVKTRWPYKHTLTEEVHGCYTMTFCTYCSYTLVTSGHRFTTVAGGCHPTRVCELCGKSANVGPVVHSYDRNAPCGSYASCTRCGVQNSKPVAHTEKSSLFGGFTYCKDCHEYTFSFLNVDWLTLICFFGGLSFFILILILIPKSRRGD